MLLFKAQPTTAQAEAGNYRKKHIRFQGLAIAIENPRGSVRRGKDRGGHEWSIKMAADYGYINGSLGVDQDQVDCYIGPDAEADTAYIVTTMAPPDFTKRDEQKVMLGYRDEASAKAAFLVHYDNPKFFGDILAMPMDEFKAKVLATKDAPKFIKGEIMLDGKIVLFIKANVGPYMRQGKMVNLSGYQGRDKRASVAPGQMALFPATEKKPMGPSPFSEDHMKHPEKHTPDLFGGDSKPLGYKEFIAAGNKDSDWDDYRDKQSKLYRERSRKEILKKWDDGAELGGNDVVNVLRSHELSMPEEIQKILQHDDTKVSKTSLSARGIKRPQASKIHKLVSESMARSRDWI